MGHCTSALVFAPECGKPGEHGVYIGQLGLVILINVVTAADVDVRHYRR